ncbi:endonuclease I [Christiangramia sabulilitoris]|uniref:Endonuclease I n=2 Tax=Christiangramia sabulilitoris TaxID=2583991 RepID=A0A550I9D0_9FLAO|nr:endonuclease I [Christiangramia sabulilitoris]
MLAALTLILVGCSTEENPGPGTEVTPEPVQKDPVANDDSFTVVEDDESRLDGYLDNDALENNARLEEFDEYTANGGQITDNRDGSFTYFPAADFTGVDTFTYTICDSDNNCSTATVSITVQDEGAPQANADETNTVVNQTLTIDNLLANDDLLDEAGIFSVETTTSAGGTAVLNNDGTVTYTPASGYKGEDTFSYTICDDDVESTCSSALVTVNVVESITFNFPSELADYYSDLSISASTELNYEFVSDHTSANQTVFLEYTDRHDYLYDADEDLNNPENVILMYTGESRYWEEYQSGSNSYNPQTYNTEHVYPQSKLNTEESKNDLHVLRVADADVNEARWNYPFTDGSGNNKLIGDDQWYPGDEWKGDVARIIMYVNVRYGDNFSDVGNLELFLKWNIEDPVSDFEIQRNNAIEAAQGNRNPFIDNPYLATLIWGGAEAENKWE